ncbi:MAG: PQQ-dependent sugar dehydrogenase [Cyclobacteriaceae bacterium]
MKNSIIRSFVVLVFSTVIFSCKPEFKGVVIESEKQRFGIDTITTELINPWGMAFLPDGRILVTERSGSIRVIQNGEMQESPLEGVPAVFAEGQGGLMEIKLHPDYENNGWIYLTYSKPGPDTTSSTTLARAKIEGNRLIELTELFNAKPWIVSDYHYGSRIAFDGAGHLFLTSGERGQRDSAQTLSNHFGKVIRLNEDGTIPSDNPFVNTPGALPEIWSYGHRNPQGLLFDTETRQLWDTEHGPMGGDELNLVEPGKNYGWPVITYGINYDSTIISTLTEKEGMEQPVRYWKPSIATCGLMKVEGDRYPNWKSNYLVGALAQMHVARVELSDGKYVREERLLEKAGRVRYVAQDPDGIIYVATEGPGSLLKLVPLN